MHVQYGITASAAYKSLLQFKTNLRKMEGNYVPRKTSDKKRILKNHGCIECTLGTTP